MNTIETMTQQLHKLNATKTKWGGISFVSFAVKLILIPFWLAEPFTILASDFCGVAAVVAFIAWLVLRGQARNLSRQIMLEATLLTAQNTARGRQSNVA